MKLGAKIFGALSAILLLYLALGYFLPSTWTAEVEAHFPQPPQAVFPVLNRMNLWPQWTAMPDSGAVLFGPSEGAGAGLRWDDPRYGKGEVLITSSLPATLVEYEVEVEGGTLRILGTMKLDPVDGGTRLNWREEGDFGWNPLLGYAARGMAGSQTEAMRESLQRLRVLLTEEQRR